MRHYLFANNQVVGPLSFREVLTHDRGTFGYTSGEDQPWFKISKHGHSWTYASRGEVPEAFLVQLMLLGIPVEP